MADAHKVKPDYIFEVSWEVCNKVGGIYTVLATKAKTLEKELGDRLVLIGPDIWKGRTENPDFIEDKSLLKLWKDHALSEGLKVKTGRWNIPGKPIVILVDFTPYYLQKNEIFTDLWIKYQLDSLTGGWDYVEPALFGYATGKVIECFYRYHLNYTDKIIAQYHEWMTGTGVLYLKDTTPQIATVFTTHATVVGRTIAGNNLPLYSSFDNYNADQVAKDYNVVAKHSLEKATAVNADILTTVSEITARECRKFLGKEPDVITPNGFDNSIVPDATLFNDKRARARRKILDVAEAMYNQKFPDDSILVIKSGRYEFKNKGLDVFIDALGQVKGSDLKGKTILAFVFVPAHQTGARKELADRLEHTDFSSPLTGEILTHNLQGAENDPILNQIKKNNLDNNIADKVRVIFSPVYLDGNDGIFNFQYYDILIAFDVAVFASYYEPWGYTPLESIAYHIPSVATDLSGFGLAIDSEFNEPRKGILVIHRDDDNYNDVVKNVAGFVTDFTGKSDDEVEQMRNDAYEVSKSFLWQKLILNYGDAYDKALQKSVKRESLFRNKPQAEPLLPREGVVEYEPTWRSIFIQPEIPKSLAALQKLSKNLWWSWDVDATELFEYIDIDLWNSCNHNPVVFLQSLNALKFRKLEHDKSFIKNLSDVEKRFDAYMAVNTQVQKPQVAYFSMEYGLNSYIKIYSGGLGILAGDYLKECSDRKENIIGIGLLYKNGYFKQTFSVHGEQLATPDSIDPANLPVQTINDEKGKPLMITLAFPGRMVYAKVWRMDVGRVPLYLLDCNVPENSDGDKNITANLYEGDLQVRLQQEILLGIGGVRLLNSLGIKPDIFHSNEGHSAFIGIERLDDLIQGQNLNFGEALEVVRSSTLFTTHTSVPAANDMFSEDLLRAYFANRAERLNISWERLMGLGRANESDHSEKFSMTYLASHLSQEINAVSKIHQKASRNMLNLLWNDFSPEELPISYVTNGVHYGTWTAKEWQRLLKDVLDGDYEEKFSDPLMWKNINDVPDIEIWDIRRQLKKNLLEALGKKLHDDLTVRRENPRKVLQIINSLDENALIIGFARRFVAYKRSDLILHDTQRLLEIVSNKDRPVLFLFSGKAHPRDTESFELMRNIISLSRQDGFVGKIIFLENYDIDLAKLLVQGVDVWLNTPYRMMEASGTSGMKATLNGVLNLSVMDGWWAEGYVEGAGWALQAKETYQNRDFQNELDAETIYSLLESEIIPLYFDRKKNNVPVDWIKMIKSAVTNIAPRFTSTRMLADYQNQYYNKLYSRSVKLKENNFSEAKNLAGWKNKVLDNWRKIEILDVEVQNDSLQQFDLGEEFKAKVVLELGELSSDDIGVEIAFIDVNPTNNDNVLTLELSVTGTHNEEITYECKTPLVQSGGFKYSFRIFPKNPLLTYRQDFNLVKWL